MSDKKLEQVKNDKWFRVWDLLVYGVIIIAVAALLICFAFVSDSSSLDGFYVSYDGERVFEYTFGGDKVILNEKVIEVEEGEDSFIVHFCDGDGGYNDIYVDVSARTVKVTASNCSTHKDCVYTAALSANGSVPILCTPHRLVISPLTFTDPGTVNT